MFFFKISYSWHFISPFCTSHKLESGGIRAHSHFNVVFSMAKRSIF
jgi:hypothetical protein